MNVMAVEYIRRLQEEAARKKLEEQERNRERDRESARWNREAEIEGAARNKEKARDIQRILQESGLHSGLTEIYQQFIVGRFKKHDLIISGARGILVWGNHYLLADSGSEISEIKVKHEKPPFFSKDWVGWLDCSVVFTGIDTYFQSITIKGSASTLLHKEDWTSDRSSVQKALAGAYLNPEKHFHNPWDKHYNTSREPMSF